MSNDAEDESNWVTKMKKTPEWKDKWCNRLSSPGHSKVIIEKKIHPFLGDYPKLNLDMRKWARMRYSELIYNVIINDNPKEEAIEKSSSLAEEIERGQYDYCLEKHQEEDSDDFVKIYKEKIRTLSLNLHCYETEYKDLVHKLIDLDDSGGFTVHESIEYKDQEHHFRAYDLAFMHYMDLQPWRFIKSKERLKRDKKGVNLPPEEMPDGAFTCGRCSHDPIMIKRGLTKKTTYYQIQCRASDEPMTIFINCGACGRRWKTS